MNSSDRLDPDLIKSGLTTQYIGSKILVYKSTSSTNDVAAEYALNRENNGLVIFSEQQSAGRGRHGKKWLSGKSDSILCSILLIPTCRDKISPETLSLTSAVAVAETVSEYTGIKAKIKWPNDILINDKKIAGILLESKTFNGNIACIIGIGINCHQTINSFPKTLQEYVTSIDLQRHTTCDRIAVAKILMTYFEHWLTIAQKHPEKVISRWRKYSSLLGHRVTVLFNSREFSGNCIGIDPQKGLILQLETGGVRMFDAAHTTIKQNC